MKKDFTISLREINKTYLITGMIFLFMMLFNLTHSSPWGDEWVEYTISQKPLFPLFSSSSMLKACANTFQPPLYNFLMHFWLMIGKTVLWFRLFNVILGLISGIMLCKTVKKLSGSTALAAGSVLALGFTYQWIYCIQECSEYALMLTFLFCALYFYTIVVDRYSLKFELLFILSCIGAMYSQYGAAFIILPLLVLYLIQARSHMFKRTFTIYIISFLLFAVPLLLFLYNQVENQELLTHSTVKITVDTFISIPLVFGKLIGYFLNLPTEGYWSILFLIIGLFFIVLCILLLMSKESTWMMKSLAILILVSYFMFYFLVEFHIYAMVHPNQSAGFYSRYAYFFVPLLYVFIPVTLYQLIGKTIGKTILYPYIINLCLAAISFLFILPMPSLLNNWNKAYDREFTNIWVENGGFSQTTYLIGAANMGFNYYVPLTGCEITGDILYSIDLDNLPDAFWIWRTNWGGEIFQEALDRASETGYQVQIYANHEYSGQLAFCSK